MNLVRKSKHKAANGSRSSVSDGSDGISSACSQVQDHGQLQDDHAMPATTRKLSAAGSHKKRAAAASTYLCFLAVLALFAVHAIHMMHRVNKLQERQDGAQHLLVDASWKMQDTSDSSNHWLAVREQAIRDATTLSHRSTSAPTVVFYNIFVPETPDGQNNSIRIVTEQLGQLATSYAAVNSNSSDPLLVLYITIGADNILTSTLMDNDLCASKALDCRHAGHYANGTEELTLQLLHDFCLVPENHNNNNTETDITLVTYIHNKGSYHAGRSNDNWRFQLTKAAVHEDCLKHVRAGDCNLCGLQFYSQWAPFIAGNLWTTTCQYASQLLTVRQHEQAVRKVVGKALLMRLRGQISLQLFGSKDRKDRLGLDRFSTEHWVGSHPDVVPCDLGTNYFHQYLYQPDIIKFDWALAPRLRNRVAPDGVRDVEMEKQMRKQMALRRKEYFFLPGLLLKWFIMYGRVPDDQSWVWNSFPDGGFWRDRAKEFGIAAVEKVMGSNLRSWNRFAKPLPIQPLIFPDNFNAAKAPYSFSKIDHAVFFDISMPTPMAGKKTSDAALYAHKKRLRSQLDILDENLSGTGAEIFYLTMGDFRPTKNICNKYDEMDCRALPHGDKLYTGELLRHEYAFCQAHPSARVSHLESRLPPALSSRGLPTDDLIALITRAVTSKACLLKADNVSCNVCGLSFSALPFMAMAGMYTADCSYVNQLLEPKLFVKKMETFLTEALTLKMRSRLVNNLFPDSMENLGLDHFAPHHWIGSGPQIAPCEAYCGGLDKILTVPDTNLTFTIAKAPLEIRTYFDNDIKVSHAIVTREVTSYRMRELTYLPGLLLKWYMIYGEAPHSSSWVYDLYADGAIWRAGIAKRGRQFLDDMLLKYMESF